MSIRIAVSMGDPTGIGPEIILRALAAGPLPHDARAVIYGSVAVFRSLAERLELPLPREAEWVEATETVSRAASAADLRSIAGRLQLQSLEAAVDAVVAGEVAAVCTAPISKAAISAAGFGYPGHTEYLASRGLEQEGRYAMMLAGYAEGDEASPLRVVPLTGHQPLATVAAALEPETAARRLVLVARALTRDFGVTSPRVALTGLNPHAGEEGLLGDDEQRVLAPALELARHQLAGSAELSGPWPADGLFAGEPELRHDAVVCCYHDQALIPFKIRHRDDGVNVTLGLRFVRTSPAHGTAFDIAGEGVARPGSMIAALRMAASLAHHRAG